MHHTSHPDAQKRGWRMSRSEFLKLAMAGAIGLGIGAAAPSRAGQGAASASLARLHQRRIPSSGESLPVIGVGTWQTFDVGPGRAEREALEQTLAVLFDAGGSVIDSSPMYGRSEGVAGDLLAQMHARDRAFIATKVWTRGREEGIRQMQRSMQLLRTERIDLMQIHNLLDWRTHLATLRAWKDEGRIRYLGITHYTASAFDEMETVMRGEKLDFVQLNYSLDDRAAEQRLLPLAAERGMGVIVNQPFGGGGLLRRLAGTPLPPWAGEIGCDSWAQVLLKYVLSHPAVTVAIPGTAKPQHMRDNCAAGAGMLPDEAMRRKMVAWWTAR
jgi:aryl-alcohol dehydrogenase-like predicted oxidoreductase